MASESICCVHKGLILVTGDTHGRVFFCPIGKQYWRYTRERSGLYAPLTYPKSGVV